MKKEDIIIHCNGRRIRNMVLLMHVALGNTEERDLSIILERDGRRLEMLLKPGQIGIGGIEHNR